MLISLKHFKKMLIDFAILRLWKTLFGKEADKLEHANDDERTYYVIENEPLVNRFISVPKDKGNSFDLSSKEIVSTSVKETSL